MCRRCGEPDKRSNSKARRERRQRLVDEYGDGEKVECFNYSECGEMLTVKTLEVDRIIPGWECETCGESVQHHKDKRHPFAGGRYNWENIRPACGGCNRQRNQGNPWTFGAETRCLTG